MMEIGMHRRRHDPVNRWRVWIRDSKGTQGFNVETYYDASRLKLAFEDLDFLLRSSSV